MLQILNGEGMSSILNKTFIALIPKVTNPEFVSDFRLISLCNVIYKLVSKTIVNRLKHLMSSIISCNQSAFLSGRFISDNILIAYELFHFMQFQKKGSTGRMAIKLDMSKAYDRIEWPYLEAVMKALGFQPPWIKLIMSCVASVQYSVLVNGRPGRVIAPSRGLR